MIYFDNAATTSSIITPKTFYNPSSPHALGINAERALRDARKTIAAALSLANRPSSSRKPTNTAPMPEEIIFTSGGTESNNLAILGFALANQRHGANLVSAPYEHPSILAPIRFAAERGWSTTHPGNATLLSISHVNHETGDINDISVIAAETKKNNPNAVIHVDGTQGFCKELINLQEVDIYTFSGHKIHGTAGVGGIWIRKGIRLTPLLHGGGQEGGLRSGSENVTGIVQMAEAAATLSQYLSDNRTHVAKLKSILLSMRDSLPGAQENSLTPEVSPYILNMSFPGIKGEILVHALSEKGVYVSMGAACNSRKRAQSSLELMGFAPQIAESAIRFSFSPYNTLVEAHAARDIIIKTVKQLQKVI